jgi:hypothetical protein
MEWHSGSRSHSHSRSRPPQLHLNTTGTFEFDDPTGTAAYANAHAGNVEGGVAIPPSVCAPGQGAGGTGSGGSGSGRSLLTRSLQIFSESPPVVGYGGWSSGLGRPAPPPQVRELLVGQPTVSSEERQQQQQQQQSEQQEARDEEEFGGFMPHSLPAYHLGFSFAPPPTTTANGSANGTIASPYGKHVRSTSFDPINSVDGSAASDLHRRPQLPKVPESALVCYLVCVCVDCETKSTTRANAGPSLARRSLLSLLSHPRTASYPASLPPTRRASAIRRLATLSMPDLNNNNNNNSSSSSSNRA